MTGQERIYKALVKKLNVKHPSVWKGYDQGTLATGWHYREFGRTDAQFLGTSVSEALETIQEWVYEREFQA